MLQDPNWAAWAKASQLGSCVVGCRGPTHPSHPMTLRFEIWAFEILVAKATANKYVCMCVCVYLS